MDTTEQLHFHFSLSCIGEGNGNPLQCSCLENPRDGGAWWAAVYGVAQSRTQLKRLSSSSSSSSSSRMPLEVTYEGEVITKMHSIFLKCKHKTEEASQLSLVAKNLPGNAGDIKDMGLIPGLGRSLGGGHGSPLQYSCLENVIDRGIWRATIYEVTKSWRVL